MSGIPIEEPPVNDQVALAEWLMRMMILISGEFERGSDQLTPQGYMPEKVQNGMIVYFSLPIAPDITQAGPWCYVEGAWVPMIEVV